MRLSKKTILGASVVVIASLGGLAWMWLGTRHVVVSPPEPPRRETAVTELAAAKSTVPITVTAPLSVLSGQVEAALPKEFPFDVNQGVHVYGRPSRGPVSISNDPNAKRTTVSTQVAGRVQVEKQVAVKISVGIDVKGGISASVSPAVAKDWAVNPNLTLSAHLDQAVAKTAVGDINVTGQVRGEVEKAVHNQKPALEAALRKTLVIRPDVEKVWSSINAVHRLKDDPPTWLRVTPRGVVFRNIEYAPESIKSGLALTLETCVFIQDEPPPALPAPLPDLETADALADEVTLTVPVEVSSEAINGLLMKALTANRTFQLSGGAEVTVTEAALRPYGDGILLTVDFHGRKGSYRTASGRLYITGIPEFDAATGRLRVDKLAYTAETESLLLKGVEWLAHGAFLEQMKAATTLDLGDELTKAKGQAKDRANDQLNELKKGLPKSVGADAEVTAVGLERLAFARGKVFAVVKARGKLSLRLQ